MTDRRSPITRSQRIGPAFRRTRRLRRRAVDGLTAYYIQRRLGDGAAVRACRPTVLDRTFGTAAAQTARDTV